MGHFELLADSTNLVIFSSEAGLTDCWLKSTFLENTVAEMPPTFTESLNKSDIFQLNIFSLSARHIHGLLLWTCPLSLQEAVIYLFCSHQLQVFPALSTTETRQDTQSLSQTALTPTESRLFMREHREAFWSSGKDPMQNLVSYLQSCNNLRNSKQDKQINKFVDFEGSQEKKS